MTLPSVGVDEVQTVHRAIGEDPWAQVTVVQDRKYNMARVSNTWLQGSGTVHKRASRFSYPKSGLAREGKRG